MPSCIKIISIGDKMAGWVKEGFDVYRQRLQGHFRLELIEITANKRSDTHQLKKAVKEESDRLQQACDPNGLTIALDRLGRNMDTPAIASQLEKNAMQNINILIGGPEGIDASLINRCDQVWSLSALTFPHPIVRIILAEQLFRAYSILSNHPYHRGN